MAKDRPRAATGTAVPSAALRPPHLRRGGAEEAGLDPACLAALVDDLTGFLHPVPGRPHPWCAGFVVLAGRGPVVALEEAAGLAVRYAGYDEAADTGVEEPADRQVSMHTDTVFDLASLTKVFTALVAARRVLDGAFGLDEPVARYLPDFGRAGKDRITVRQVLTHTSGLRPELPFHAAGSPAARLRMLWDEAPLHAPGTTAVYSDLNLIALHLLLEAVTGRPLDVLVREEVTGPLGMRSTRFAPPPSWRPRTAATEDQRRPWAKVDRGMLRGEVHDENAHAFGGVAGHAGLFSTAWDLALLCRALLDGGPVADLLLGSVPGPDARRAGGVRHHAPGLRPGAGPVPAGAPDSGAAFAPGLGLAFDQPWFMGELAGPRTAGHTGFTGTSLVVDPVRDVFLVILANSVHPVRTWRAGSAPRAAAATRLARAADRARAVGRPGDPAPASAARFSGGDPGSGHAPDPGPGGAFPRA